MVVFLVDEFDDFLVDGAGNFLIVQSVQRGYIVFSL